MVRGTVRPFLESTALSILKAFVQPIFAHVWPFGNCLPHIFDVKRPRLPYKRTEPTGTHFISERIPQPVVGRNFRACFTICSDESNWHRGGSSLLNPGTRLEPPTFIIITPIKRNRQFLSTCEFHKFTCAQKSIAVMSTKVEWKAPNASRAYLGMIISSYLIISYDI